MGHWRIPNSVYFNIRGLTTIVGYQLEFATTTGKSTLERLMHLWAFDDEKRQGWEEKKVLHTLSSHGNKLELLFW